MNDFTSYMNTNELPWDTNQKELIPLSEPEVQNFQFQTQKSVSGIGIQSGDDEENIEENAQLLNSLNANNTEYVEQERERKEAEESERMREADAARKQARAQFLKERFEAEQAAKKLREEQEAEEQARLEAEAEARRKANPLFKLAGAAQGVLKKKPKPEKGAPEETEEIAEDTKGTADPPREEEIAEAPKKEKEHLFAKKPKKEAPETKELLSNSLEVSTDVETFFPVVQADSTEKEEPKEKQEKAPKKPLFAFGKKTDDTEKPKKEPKPKKEKAVKEKPAKPVKEKPAKKGKSSGKETGDEKDWKYLATHDDLTGLLNTHAFDEARKQYISNSPAIFLVAVEYEEDGIVDLDIVKYVATATKSIPGVAYRIKDSGFVIIGEEEMSEERASAFASRFMTKFDKDKKGSSKMMGIELGIGYATGGKYSLDKAMSYAVKRMSEIEQKRREMAAGEVIDYDALLTKDQRALKETVRENHIAVGQEKTEQIIMEIQRKQNEIEMILMSDKNFDNLFIIQDVNSFIGIVTEMDSMIDYSYLYVVWEGGAQYYGADEYFKEITDIFQTISDKMKSGQIRTEKDVIKIQGINIFKHIYIE